MSVEQIFKKINFQDEGFDIESYECCTFIECDLAEIDLIGSRFIECTFDGCNLANVGLRQVVMQDTVFKECKMIGLRMEDMDDLGLKIDFQECVLNFTSFYGMKLKKCQFSSCIMHDVDFSDSDLTGIDITDCDLTGATFDNTILEKSNLEGSYNFKINPTNNRIRGARFSKTELSGLLDSLGIIVV